MTTEHPTLNEWQEFLAGTLPTEECKRLDSHLKSCSCCQELLAELANPQRKSEQSVDEDPASLCHEPLSDDAKSAGPCDPPKVIGDYRLSSEVDFGAFGKVYRATKASNSEVVAIKIFQRRDDAAHEAAIFRRIGKHNGVIGLYEAKEENAPPFLVLEIADGTLRDEMERKLLTIDEIVDFIEQLANAMAHVHERKIFHRDVKPDNILVKDSSKSIKLCDFGISKHRSASTLADGQGSNSYMAPEVRAGEEPDARADIYSLGVVFYEMLTQELPKDNNPTPPSQTNETIPRYIEDLCLDCLENSPAKRPRHMREFIERLAPPPHSVSPLPQTLRRLSALGAVVLVLITTITHQLWWLDATIPTPPAPLAEWNDLTNNLTSTNGLYTFSLNGSPMRVDGPKGNVAAGIRNGKAESDRAKLVAFTNDEIGGQLASTSGFTVSLILRRVVDASDLVCQHETHGIGTPAFKPGWAISFSGDGVLRVSISNKKRVNALNCFSRQAIPKGRYVHLHVTFDGRRKIEIYVNGKQVDTYHQKFTLKDDWVLCAPQSVSLDFKLPPLVIGSGYDSKGLVTGANIDLAVVRLWDRELDEKDILWLHSRAKEKYLD